MFKKITVVSLVLIFSLSLGLDSSLRRTKRESIACKKYNDTNNISSGKMPYSGEMGSAFDQSFNGYGFKGY